MTSASASGSRSMRSSTWSISASGCTRPSTTPTATGVTVWERDENDRMASARSTDHDTVRRRRSRRGVNRVATNGGSSTKDTAGEVTRKTSPSTSFETCEARHPRPRTRSATSFAAAVRRCTSSALAGVDSARPRASTSAETARAPKNARAAWCSTTDTSSSAVNRRTGSSRGACSVVRMAIPASACRRAAFPTAASPASPVAYEPGRRPLTGHPQKVRSGPCARAYFRDCRPSAGKRA